MAFNDTRSSTAVYSTAMLVTLLVVSFLLFSTSAEFGREECTVVNYDCDSKPYLCEESCRAKAASEGSDRHTQHCEDSFLSSQKKCCCTVLNPR